MKIIKDKISISELREMANRMRDDLVKAIVDVQKCIMAVDDALHADLFEAMVKEEHCEPQNLWGINIYPNKEGPGFIEFDSMMNVRPNLGNKTRSIESAELRNKIIKIVEDFIGDEHTSKN